MKVLIIVLVVIAVLLVAALIWMAVNRKKDQQSRLRADELRSQAADTARHHDEQAARAREAEAEAERARAQAARLEARAEEERTSYDQTRALHEDHLREADRIDPDVDHRAEDYQPGAGAVRQHDGHANGHVTEGHVTEGHVTEGHVADGHATGEHEAVDSETGERRTWSGEQPPGRHQG